MKYQIAEKFKSLQGEGVYAGTPMAFIRFVGCTVGKKICQHCDTVFERMLPWQGGGEFSAAELINEWRPPYKHICLTGGEPLDQDLVPLVNAVMNLEASRGDVMIHVETSGTRHMLTDLRAMQGGSSDHRSWICVSPKPGFLEEEVLAADEIKVIVPGLGTSESLLALAKAEHMRSGTGHAFSHRDTFRWPDINDALRWADAGKTVFLQPRNGVTEIDKHNLMIVMDLLRDHPNLRLSAQLHKILKVQ